MISIDKVLENRVVSALRSIHEHFVGMWCILFENWYTSYITYIKEFFENLWSRSIHNHCTRFHIIALKENWHRMGYRCIKYSSLFCWNNEVNFWQVKSCDVHFMFKSGTLCVTLKTFKLLYVDYFVRWSV